MRKANYQEFWPFYLQEHAKTGTRYLHFIGTALAIGLLGSAIVSANPWLFLAVPIAGYFFAWIAHAFVERNKPATFTHPLWSLISDFRMFFLWIKGQLDAELKKAGIDIGVR